MAEIKQYIPQNKVINIRYKPCSITYSIMEIWVDKNT